MSSASTVHSLDCNKQAIIVELLIAAVSDLPYLGLRLRRSPVDLVRLQLLKFKFLYEVDER